jgi:hypothetical protein
VALIDIGVPRNDAQWLARPAVAPAMTLETRWLALWPRKQSSAMDLFFFPQLYFHPVGCVQLLLTCARLLMRHKMTLFILFQEKRRDELSNHFSFKYESTY